MGVGHESTRSTQTPASSVADDTHIARLIAAARSGSREDLGRLFETCRRYLLLAATRALDSDLRPKAGASDLVQDTFLEVQRDFDQFDGTSERDLFAWLTTILKHRLANNIRRYHTHKRLVHLEVSIDGIDGDRASPDLPDHDADTPSSVMRRAEETCRVKEAMDSLPASYQEVIWLRTWQQKSFAEVGKTMDRSSDAARKLWTRAISQLSKCMNDER